MDENICRHRKNKIVLNYKIVIGFSILYIIDEHTELYSIDLARTNETLNSTAILQLMEIDKFESLIYF